MVPLSTEGGAVAVEGEEVRGLSVAEHEGILAAFEPLSPASWWPVWESDRGTEKDPLRFVAFGPKRHAELSAGEVCDFTESGLGGTYADPPGLRGRELEGPPSLEQSRRRARDRLCTRTSCRPRERHATSCALGRRVTAHSGYSPLHREDPGDGKAPAATSRWASWDPLPPDLWSDLARASWGRTIVALDPGGDLADWQDLVWFDKTTGERVPSEFVPETLADRAAEWSRRPRSEPIDEVVIHPDLVTSAGAVSAVIDAEADGLSDVRSRRPIYEETDRRRFVYGLAGQLGPRPFERATGIPLKCAERLALGRPVADRTIAAAFRAPGSRRRAECAHSTAVTSRSTDRTPCTTRRHVRTAPDRIRRKEREAASAGTSPNATRCAGCAAELLGAAVGKPCPICAAPN